MSDWPSFVQMPTISPGLVGHIMGSNSGYNINQKGIQVLLGSSLRYEYEVLVEQQKYPPQLIVKKLLISVFTNI